MLKSPGWADIVLSKQKFSQCLQPGLQIWSNWCISPNVLWGWSQSNCEKSVIFWQPYIIFITLRSCMQGNQLHILNKIWASPRPSSFLVPLPCYCRAELNPIFCIQAKNYRMYLVRYGSELGLIHPLMQCPAFSHLGTDRAPATISLTNCQDNLLKVRRTETWRNERF